MNNKNDIFYKQRRPLIEVKVRGIFGEAHAFIEKQPYFLAESPQIIAEVGLGDVRLVVNVATHGNEVLPVIAAHKAIELLKNQHIDGCVRFTVANPPALRVNKRFIESDLNRIYPGKSDGTIEERLATEMFPYIDSVPFVLDMHTSPNTPPFVVMVDRSRGHLEFAEHLGIQDIALLVMKPEPHSMVQFAHYGVGVELGLHNDETVIERGVHVIANVMRGIGMLPMRDIPRPDYRYYAMTGLISRETVAALPSGMIQDFVPVENHLVRMEPEDGVTIPILSDPNRTFSDHYCLALKKVSRDYLEIKEEV